MNAFTTKKPPQMNLIMGAIVPIARHPVSTFVRQSDFRILNLPKVAVLVSS